MTGRERLLAAIQGGEPDSLPHIPITMMKAADQIGALYGVYARDAETHARGQLAIARAFDIDHVSVISDPAVEAADLGACIFYPENAPPAIDDRNALLSDKARLLGLKTPDPWKGARMRKRLDVARLLKEGAAGDMAVEGWIEGPIAESCDLRGINAIMTDFFDDPDFVRDLMAFVLEVEISFARAQVEAGIDIMGVGDAAASLIGPQLYREFVWENEKKLVDAVRAMGVPVRLHICGDITPLLGMVSEVKADILDLDSMVSMAVAREKLGAHRLIAGNVNPVAVMKDGTPRSVTMGLEQCLREAGGRCYAVAAGCEIPRDTPDANLLAMREFARSRRWSPAKL